MTEIPTYQKQLDRLYERMRTLHTLFEHLQKYQTESNIAYGELAQRVSELEVNMAEIWNKQGDLK